MGKHIIIYTDASYDQNSTVAACGFVILIDKKIHCHNVYLVSGIPKSSDAERYAIILALKDLPQTRMFDVVIVNTDHMACIHNLTIRKGGIDTEFKKAVGRIKKKGVQILIKHVKGHSGNHFNSLVDKSCHKELRKFVKGTLQKPVPAQ